MTSSLTWPEPCEVAERGNYPNLRAVLDDRYALLPPQSIEPPVEEVFGYWAVCCPALPLAQPSAPAIDGLGCSYDFVVWTGRRA